MNVKRTTSLSTLYLTGVVVGFAIFAIMLSGILMVKLREVIVNSEQVAVESSFATIQSHLLAYLEERAIQLTDHAEFPLIVQTVMQPEQNVTILKDFMGELRVLGEFHQLVLTDFRGEAIHRTKFRPLFTHSDASWIEDMMEEKISQYISYRQDGDQYYWEIAVPVLYNNRPEGVLITEIPIGPGYQLQRLRRELQHARLQLRLADQIIGTWGELDQESTHSIEHDSLYGLGLHYQVNHQNISSATQEVLFPILFLCGAVMVLCGGLGLIVGKKFLIQPIEELKADSSSLLNEEELHLLSTDQAILELQELAHHMNIVQERAWSRKQDILAMNTSLEFRVNQATKELSHQNHDLMLARDEALVAVRSKALFLASMSHEIRTPMNGILGMTELLSDTELSVDQQELIHTLHSSGENLLTIINDILDFSKIESGKLTIEQIDFDLRSSVEEVLNILTTQAQAKGLELVGLVHANTPTLLRGDPVRFRQVLTNLVGNAIKFTATGEVFIQVTSFAVSNSEAHLRIEVKDTGIGISSEEQSNLFQAFMQANQDTTRKYGGTGLGLAICRQLVGLMNGEIGVTSTTGTGSSFWFTLKFPIQTMNASKILPEVLLKEHRVLFVDDNATNRFILEHYAESWGMHSSSASSGAQALILLDAASEEGYPFDLAVIDQKMPDMDGFELAHAIKAKAKWINLPLILLTSLGYKGEANKAKQAHFSGYLTKPIHQQTLRRSVALVLGLEQDARQGKDQELITRHTVQEQVIAEKSHILLAEDNLVNQKVAVRMLTKLGFHVDVANNGQEAIEAWGQKPYDIILMDCQMPEIDGFQATKTIREAERVKREALGVSDETQKTDSPSALALTPHENFHIPIIAMTANTMEGDREQCLEAGMDDFIAKPVKMEFLGQVLEKWLPSKNSEESQQVVTSGYSTRSPV